MRVEVKFFTGIVLCCCIVCGCIPANDTTPPLPPATQPVVRSGTPTHHPTPSAAAVLTQTPATIPVPEPTATATPHYPPVVAQPPEGTLLFVERISEITPVYDVELDFTAYLYSEDALEGTDRHIPALRPGDIGYFGAQIRLHSPGSGGAGVIEIIRTLPLDDRAGGIRILSIHENGGVLVSTGAQTHYIPSGGTLALGERDEIGAQSDLVPGPRHVVEVFVNHGFIERSKVYSR